MAKVFLVFCLAVIIAGSCWGEIRNPPRPGSFVRYAANSVEELVRQVSQDSVVAKRYSEHFDVSKDYLVQYFRNNLQVTKLTKPEKFKMHFVSKTGTILCRNCWLPAGHKVFATTSGEPVLDIGCGNPITEKLPAIKSKVKGLTQVISAKAREEALENISQGAHETPSETEPLEALDVATVQFTQEETLLRLAEPEISTPLTMQAYEPLLMESTPKVSFLQLTRGLLPALWLVHKPHSTPGGPQPPIVPEQQAVATLLVGTIAVALKIRHRELVKSK